MIPGELYPGGPAELPCWVELGGETYQTRHVPPATLAYLACTGRWTAYGRELLTPECLTRVDQRRADDDDDLDNREIAEMAVHMSIRLAGLGDGILGWRAMMHISGQIVAEWRDMAGILIDAGVDPARDQLWRVMATVYRVITSIPDEAQRAWVKTALKYPLPREPYFLDGAGTLVGVLEDAAASFDAMAKALGGD